MKLKIVLIKLYLDKNMEKHHIIPISLYWEDTEANILKISASEHKDLHECQNIPYRLLRSYRTKVNWILIPNDYTLDLKGELWKQYFSNARTYKEEQLTFIRLQGYLLSKKTNSWALHYSENFSWAIDDLIEEQKIKVAKVMEWYELTKRLKSYFKDYLVND